MSLHKHSCLRFSMKSFKVYRKYCITSEFMPLPILFVSYMPISGFQGVLSGFLVGVKQIMPDQELSILKLKAKVQPLELPIWFLHASPYTIISQLKMWSNITCDCCLNSLQWLPSLALLLSTVISFFTADSVSYLPTIVFGTYLGWIYLRYWQKKPETKLKGDPSDKFAFSSFFPEFLRYFLIFPLAMDYFS